MTESFKFPISRIFGGRSGYGGGLGARPPAGGLGGGAPGKFWYFEAFKEGILVLGNKLNLFSSVRLKSDILHHNINNLISTSDNSTGYMVHMPDAKIENILIYSRRSHILIYLLRLK